jgi:hypothetical protein
MADTYSDAETIERDLDATRSRLDSDLSQLQERLSPGQLLDDVLRYFRGADGGDFGRRLMDSVRANPMPVVVTGIGLAWMIASRQRSDADGDARVERRDASDLSEEEYATLVLEVRGAEQGVTRGSDEDEHSFSARLDEARGKVMGLTREAKETAESFAQRVKDALSKAEQALSKAGDKIGAMGQSAQNAATDAKRKASDALARGREAGGKLVDKVADDPILLAAVGIAAGALAGALLPVSDKEEEALGAAAAKTRETANALAKEGLEHGKHIAQTIVDKGRESVQAHGLAGGKTPGQLVDAALSGDLAHEAKAVAEEVLRAGEDAVRQETAALSQPQQSQPQAQPQQ